MILFKNLIVFYVMMLHAPLWSGFLIYVMGFSMCQDIYDYEQIMVIMTSNDIFRN